MKKTILKFFLLTFFVFQIFSWGAAKPEYENLVFKPDAKYFFTQQENGYTLIVPGCDSSKIEIDLPELPAGVKFLSSIREEYIDSNGRHGTKLHFWFSFTDTGSVVLPALTAIIENHEYKLKFQKIDVFEHPTLINPLLLVEFENDKKNPLKISKDKNGISKINIEAGKTINYTVYVQFAVQIYNFDYVLPKNSIFTELGHWDRIDERENPGSFSTKKFPVAQFEWKPLVEGVYEIPQVTLYAIAYNGARRQVYLPKYRIEVSKMPETSLENKKNSVFDENEIFSSAFDKFEDESLSAKYSFASTEHFKSLAAARSAERHAFPWDNSVVLNRELIESEVGISSPQNEPSIPLLRLFLVIFSVFFIAMIVLILFKHVRTSLFFAFLSGVSLIFALTISVKLIPKYAIFAGNQINAIPEEDSSSIHSVTPGQRVQLLENAGNWIYIECTDYSGWVLKNSVYEIR